MLTIFPLVNFCCILVLGCVVVVQWYYWKRTLTIRRAEERAFRAERLQLLEEIRQGLVTANVVIRETKEVVEALVGNG